MYSEVVNGAYAAESRLIQTIYQSASTPESWTAFMGDLVGVLNSRSSRLLVMNESADVVRQSYVLNHDDSYTRQYVEHYVNKCPWRPELASKASGALYSTYLDFSCKQDEFKKTEFYNDWARPQNIEHGICGTVYEQPGMVVQLLVQRTREAGHFTRAETDFVTGSRRKTRMKMPGYTGYCKSAV